MKLRFRETLLVAGALLALFVVGGCTKSDAATRQDRTSGPAGAMDPESGFVYSPARWRLATFKELDRSTVWLSHIVIRHSESDPSFFRALTWRPDPPNPTRSLKEARALAERLADQAAKAPQDFGALARQHSEDVVTRDLGGTLGGMRASQLVITGLLDAAAALRPGQVSRAFRTPFGFHVLKREPPPPDQALSGERIVVGYDTTLELAREVGRSREQARAIALDVSSRAKAAPGAFRALVEQYSDNADRVQQGDLGVYSRRDPGYLPLEIEALSRLAEGEISEPIDTRFGFTVLKRVPVVARENYAMTAIELRFDPALSEGPFAQAQVFAAANQLSQELNASPERFEELQQQHCCARVQRWTRGRGPLGVTPRLAQLALGQIATAPWLWDDFYIIPRRLDPAVLAPEAPPVTELPSPSKPDFLALLEFNEARNIAGAARSLAEAIGKQPRLSQDIIDGAARPIVALADQLEQGTHDAAGVKRAVLDTLDVINKNLGPEQFQRFSDFASRWATDQLMPPIADAQ